MAGGAERSLFGRGGGRGAEKGRGERRGPGTNASHQPP
jgi:hypothetical protein